MKKYVILFILLVSSIAVMPNDSGINYSQNAIDKIKLITSDIPDGFIFGEIPPFARDTITGNPVQLNRTSIGKLTKNLYPDGEASSVQSMYLSILAKKDHPYNDDIVCYIILFNDLNAAAKEIDKLTSYNNANSDRTILLVKGNIAVFLIVDDIMNYKYIDQMQNIINEKIKTL